MAKEMEIFDSLIQSQKEMLDTWIRVQKDFFSNMADSARRMQEAAICPGCTEEAEGAQKETIDRYNQMVDTMVNSSKIIADQAMKLQDAWQETFKKQIDTSMGMARNFMELGRQRMEQAQQGRWQQQRGEEAA